MNKILIVVYISALLAGMVSCQPAAPVATPTSPPATTTPTPQPDLTIELDPNDLRQTIREVGGGNFIHLFSGSMSTLEPVSQLNIQTLNPTVIRVRLGLEDWEPVNDNNDSLAVAADRFQDTGYNHAAFDLMHTMRTQYSVTHIIATVWDVPNWLVQNPGETRNRIIPLENYPEAVESIAQWLVHARDVYGVEVDYVSFNEPNIGVNVALTSADEIEMIRLAGPRFAALGLKTKWLLGDCSNMGGCINYVTPIWATEEIRPYLGPLAIHSWDSSASDWVLEEIAAFAQKEGLDVWCTEAGWDPFLWESREMFPKWFNGLELAMIYSRVLKLSRVSVMDYWQMMGQDYSLNNGQTLYPALEVLHQFKIHFPAGSQVIDSSKNSDFFLNVAARTPAGFSVALVNINGEPVVVEITGLPDGIYTLTRVSETDRETVAGMYTSAGGRLIVEIAPASVNFISTK
jgi:hypothetical protein